MSEQQTAEKIDLFDRKRAKAFEELVQHEGWKLYIELLTNMIEQRGADLIGFEPQTMDDLVRLATINGPMKGLVLARDLVPLTIAGMKDAKPQATGDDDA